MKKIFFGSSRFSWARRDFMREELGELTGRVWLNRVERADGRF